jgi:hypothetical protein
VILINQPSGVMFLLIQPSVSNLIKFRDAVCWEVPIFSAKYSVEALTVRLKAPSSASLKSVKSNRQDRKSPFNELILASLLEDLATYL